MTLRRPKKGPSSGSTKKLRSQKTGGNAKSLRHQQDGSAIVLRRATDQSGRRRGTHLIYGRSGTGKTTLASTYPKPILLIDIKDEGDDSVSDIEDVFVYEPQSLEEFEAIFWALKHDKAFRKFRRGTVIVDTITQLQALIVADVGSRKSKAKYAGKKPAGAWGTMTKGDWGTAADIMKTQIMNFRSLECHTVFIAQEKMVDPDEGNDDGVEDIMTPEVGPALMKSVATVACSASSFIGHTFIRSRTIKNKLRKKRVPEYCMRVGPNPVYITKTRKPKSIVMPDFVVNPTFDLISNLAKGK